MVALCCTACANDMPAVQHITEQQTQTTSQAIEIIISHSQNEHTPEDLAARAMRDKLQELLGDSAEIILYADYQLGSAEEQLEALELGRIDITIQSTSYVSQLIDDLKVFTLPYVFSTDAQEIIAVLDGPLEQEALERISQECGEPIFKGLGLWFGGYKLFTFHGLDGKRVHSPADFCGLSIAIPDASILKAQYLHWGANPVVIEDIARYSALTQRIADGSEATISQIISNYLYEVQHNIVQAYHGVEVYTVLTNAQWFSALPINMQEAIVEAEVYAKEKMYEALAEQEPVYIDTIRQAEGMRYEVLTEDEIAMFKASTESIYTEQLAGSPWQMDYVKRIRQCFT